MSEQSNDEHDQEHKRTHSVSSMDGVEMGIALSSRKSPSNSHVEYPMDLDDDPAELEMIMVRDVKAGAEVSFLLILNF